MVWWVIWHEQGTSQDWFLRLNDVMFTCHVFASSECEMNACSNRWLSKPSSTFVLTLLKRSLKLNEFLVFFYTNFPEDFGEAKGNWRKMIVVYYWICDFVCLAERVKTISSGQSKNKIESVTFKALRPSSRRRDVYAISSLVIFYTDFHENFGESTVNDRR